MSNAYVTTKTTGVGVLFYASNTGRHLYLLRTDRNQHTWGLPGGKVERGETLIAALERECREEINFWTVGINLYPLEQFISSNGKFTYHTFFSIVPYEFHPTLNHEHIGYCWVDSHSYPRPLHRGLFNTLNYPTIQQKISMILGNKNGEYNIPHAV